jgi:hypothetical protein
MNFKSLAVNPLTYVIGFAVGGAGCVVAGVSVMVGAGPGLLAAGCFLIGAAVYITRGMKPNG